jgi:hypothetical protein
MSYSPRWQRAAANAVPSVAVWQLRCSALPDPSRTLRKISRCLAACSTARERRGSGGRRISIRATPCGDSDLDRWMRTCRGLPLCLRPHELPAARPDQPSDGRALHPGCGSLQYDPLPARLVSRGRLRFVYFEGRQRSLTFIAIRQAAREMGVPD